MSQQPNSPDSDIAIDRRTFVKTAGAAGVGLALAGCAGGSGGKSPATQASVAAAPRKDGPRRYAIVGMGSRSSMYQNAIERDYKQHAQLVGLCDKNPGRLELARTKSSKNEAPPPAAYAPDDFEKMIREQRVDTVIVTTVD